jgi:O-antigen ligase
MAYVAASLPSASSLGGSEPSAARATAGARDLERSLFALGLLLPLLGGGNVLFVLEPNDAMPYLALAAIGVWHMLSRRPRQQGTLAERPASLPTAFLSVLGAGWIAQLLFRPSGPRAFLEAQGMFGAMLLFASFARGSLRRAEIVALLHGMLVGALVTVAYGQYQYWVMFPRLMPLLVAARLPAIDLVNANFYNANCYAAFLAALILLGIGVASLCARPAIRAIVIAALAAFAVTLLLSESRSTIGMLLVALAALLESRTNQSAVFRRHWRLGAWALAPVVAILAALLTVVDTREFWQVGFLGRFAIWRASLAVARDHWLIGVGVGRFWDYFPSYRINTYYTRYPHNFLLEICAEQGLVAGVAITGFVVSAFARPLRRLVTATASDRRADLLPASMILAAGLLCVHALLDIDWHAPANVILLFALLGISQFRPTAPGTE